MTFHAAWEPTLTDSRQRQAILCQFYNFVFYNVHVAVALAEAIQVTLEISGLGADNLLHLVPATAARSGQITWTFESPDTSGIKITRVPPYCRGG